MFALLKRLIEEQRRYKGQSRERSSITLESFVDEFRGENFPHAVLTLVFSELSSLTRLPPKRGDDLVRDLYLDEDEFSDVLIRLANHFGVPRIEDSRFADDLPLQTVDDFVRFVTALAESDQANRPDGGIDDC